MTRGRCFDQHAALWVVLWASPCLAQTGAPGSVRDGQRPSQEAIVTVAPGEAPRTPPNTDVARDFFRQGSVLAAANQWAEALAAYQNSYRHHPHAETRFNIGVCYNHLGQPVRAWSEISRAITGSGLAPAGYLSEQRRALAIAELELVERSLTRVHVSNTPNGMRLLVDGRQLAEADSPDDLRVLANDGDATRPTWASDDVLLVEPGEHVVQLSLRNARQEQHFVARPGERVLLRWAPEEPAQPQHAATSGRTDVASSKEPRPPRPTPALEATWRDWAPVAAWSFVGISVVASGVGGLWTLSAHEKLEARCPERLCTERERPLVSQYESAVSLTNAGLMATASGLAVALSVTLLTSDDDSTRFVVSPSGITYRRAF